LARAHGIDADRVLARLEQVAAELRATSVEVTDNHIVGDQVLAVFKPRDSSRSPTEPTGFAALLEADQC